MKRDTAAMSAAGSLQDAAAVLQRTPGKSSGCYLKKDVANGSRSQWGVELSTGGSVGSVSQSCRLRRAVQPDSYFSREQ